jgi:hypothetical protein
MRLFAIASFSVLFVGDYVKRRSRRIIRKRVGPVQRWEKAAEVRKVYLENDEASC